MTYKITGIAFLFLTLALNGFAQNAKTPPPPPPPGADTYAADSYAADSDANQSEVIIRQKGDKNTKVTIEIRNGNFFVNGTPIDKFSDNNVEIELRNTGEDNSVLTYGPSPFRENFWNQERSQRDLQRNLQRQDMQLRRFRHEGNEAFLGVSSRKTETAGATILNVTKPSPAEKAGLKAGDIITKLNDEKIESPEALYESVHQYKPGDKVKITYTREGKEKTVSAVLEKSKNDLGEMNFNYKYRVPPIPSMPEMGELPEMPGMESPLWGPMPPKIGIKAQDPEDGKGVNVLDVTEGSPADKAGIKKGDLITRFDGSDVNSANQLIQKLRSDREKASVKVEITRNGKQQDLEIKIPRKLKTAEL
jgi:serine protease Do